MKKIILAAIFLLTITGCVNFTNNSPIVIGGLIPLEGSNVLYGEWGMKAINLRIQQINESGGINGRNLEIVWVNGMCNREESLIAAKELIEKHNVKVIYGGFCSEETLGAAPLAEENEVLLVSPLSTSPEITKAGDFIFRTSPSNVHAGGLLADFAHDNGVKKIAIIQEPGIHNTMKESLLNKYNGEYLEVYVDDEKMLQKIAEFKAEALLVNVTSFKALNELVGKIGGVELGIPILLNEVMTGAVEVMSSYREIPIKARILGVTFDVDTGNPELVDFMDLYEEAIGRSPAYARFLGMGLDAINVIIEALKGAEDVRDAKSIRKVLLETNHMGYSGLIRFDENGDVRIKQVLFEFDGNSFSPRK